MDERTRRENEARIDGEELVPEADACPTCGERRMDWLGWDDDGEYVTCATCGAKYAPEQVA